MRAIFARAADQVDAHYAAYPRGGGELEATLALFSDAQAAKAFVTDGAQRVVDRALALSGGAGFANKHPLARLYRDARAGAFMHPLGSNRAFDFIGNVTLGLEPSMS
jgi:alkylation response protein AidB-like acyl-CoA dehydrogenase